MRALFLVHSPVHLWVVFFRTWSGQLVSSVFETHGVKAGSKSPIGLKPILATRRRCESGCRQQPTLNKHSYSKRKGRGRGSCGLH